MTDSWHVLSQLWVPRLFTCDQFNATSCIAGIYNVLWKYNIYASIMTSFFIYNFPATFESEEASHNWHCFFSLKVILPCTVKHTIRWYIWKLAGITLELYWSCSIIGRSIRLHCTKHRKTYYQYVNVFFDDGFANIFAISMSDAVLNICLPYGMMEFLYVSSTRFHNSTDLLFCALQILSRNFKNNNRVLIIITSVWF